MGLCQVRTSEIARKALFRQDMIRAHRKLKAWQIARTLVKDIYGMTRTFPSFEQYGLSAQMQRAAISIPSNIAEGAGRKSSREFRRFLLLARGSLAELETQLLLAGDLEYIENVGDVWKKVNELFGLLNGLIARHQS